MELFLQTAHKIGLKPNNKEMTYFCKASGVARFSYNWALFRWKEEYEAGGKPSESNLRKRLNALKKIEYPWMLEVTNDQFKVNGNRIRIPNLGWVRMKESFRFKGKISSATISRTADRWFVSISVDAEELYDKKESEWRACPERGESQAATGVDLGITTFATLSNGKEVKGPKALKRYEKQLKRAARSFSRKKKGSQNRQKAKIKLAKLHAKVSNSRKDAIHKLTHEIARDFGVIGIEKLNVKGMMKNHKLARSLSDMAFGEFSRQMTYKVLRRGGLLFKAKKWFPSSKICSADGCAEKNKGLKLSMREWTCDKCGAAHQRDVNAAINLHKMAVSSTGTDCGASSFGGTGKGSVYEEWRVEAVSQR